MTLLIAKRFDSAIGLVHASRLHETRANTLLYPYSLSSMNSIAVKIAMDPLRVISIGVE